MNSPKPKDASASGRSKVRLGPVTKQPAFIALSAAAFVSGANLRLFDSLLPNVAEYFAAPVSKTSMVVTAFTLAYGLFQIVHGPLGDRFGKLRIIGLATFLVAAASVGSSFAPSLRTLTWLRFMSGAGAAAIIPLSFAWIGDNSSYETRQSILGRFIGFLLMGQVLGPAMGGILAQYVSWREVFLILAAIFLGVSLVLLREIRKNGTPKEPGKRVPVLRNYYQILKVSGTRAILVAVFFEGVVFYGSFAYAGAFLKYRFAIDYLFIGSILACYGLGGITYSLLVGRLRTRWGEKEFIGIGVTIILLCFAMLTFIPVWQALFPLFGCIGFGFFLFHNTLQTRATEMAPQARGMAVALFAFALFTGQAAGVWLFGRLVDAGGYRWPFIVAGFLIGLLGWWFSRLPDSGDGETSGSTAASREV